MTGSGNASFNHPLPVSAVPAWDAATDVMIVGYGAAGACAALEAARAGAQVCIVEASGTHGGASALSSGEIYAGGGGGTTIQRAAGFEDTSEDMYRYLLMAGGPDADAAKVRLYVDRSLEHFGWMQQQGIPFKNSYIPERILEPETDDCLVWSGSEEAWPFSTHAKPCPRGFMPQWPGGGTGKQMMDVLATRVAELPVELRFETRCSAMVVDTVGRVCGIVARHAGREFFLQARRGVILCAGGFIMNEAMLRRHAPLALRANRPIGALDDGSGILLGQSVGGNAIHMDEIFATLPQYPPEQNIHGILIDGRGQRFINEDCYHGRVTQYLLRRSGTRFWLLLDHASYVEQPFREFFRIGIGATGETWAEVETELGLPTGALTATIEFYNRHAAEGRDPLFHKAARWLRPLVQPPFVALDFRIDYALCSTFTLGGLDTLSSGEVLDAARKPIAGLFAAGRTACGIPRWGEGYSSGMSVGDSTFFGRMAGLAAGRNAIAPSTSDR